MTTPEPDAPSDGPATAPSDGPAAARPVEGVGSDGLRRNGKWVDLAAVVSFVALAFWVTCRLWLNPGVDEDQVCVTAHCKLTPFWARRLGRQALVALQLSQRGGRLEVEHRGDRVRVLGAAVRRGGARDLALALR